MGIVRIRLKMVWSRHFMRLQDVATIYVEESCCPLPWNNCILINHTHISIQQFNAMWSSWSPQLTVRSAALSWTLLATQFWWPETCCQKSGLKRCIAKAVSDLKLVSWMVSGPIITHFLIFFLKRPHVLKTQFLAGNCFLDTVSGLQPETLPRTRFPASNCVW